MGVRPSAVQKKRSGLVALGAAGVLFGVVALLMAGGGGGRPEQFAEQFDAPPVTIGSGGTHAWSSLEQREGIRANWPIPMLARGAELCFGFGRVDFVPTRPSLARCVDRGALPELPANGVVPVMSVQAGLDVWYVLATGSVVDSLDLRSADDAVGPDRVHVDEDVIVLRVPTGARIEELSWVSGRIRFVCRPPAAGVSADRFCATTEPSPTTTRPRG